MGYNLKMRIKRLLVSAITVTLILSGFSLMPAASQLVGSDSDYGVAYAASSKVKVTFNANGGKIGSAKTKAVSVTKGKSIAKLPDAKRTGYSLKGWYTKKAGGKKISTKAKVTKKVTYYAQWTAKKYTLKYDAIGGKVTPASKKVAYKKGYGALPTPTLSGHTFEGWFTAKTGGTKVSATTKMPAKNVTVYAQWKKSRVLTAEEKKLVGTWGILSGGGSIYNANTGEFLFDEGTGAVYTFRADGTFDAVVLSNYSSTQYALFIEGTWKVSSGIIHMSDRKYRDSRDGGKTWSDWAPMATPNNDMKYKLGNDAQGLYLEDTEDNTKYRNW